TEDFAPMLSALDETVAALDVTARRFPDRTSEIAEGIAFLQWLRPNFVFLCYDALVRVDQPDEALAPVADAASAGLGLARPDLQARRAEPILPTPAVHAQAATDAHGATPVRRHPRPDPRPGEQDSPPEPQRWPPRLLVIGQTLAESTVQRRSRMHAIIVRGVEGDAVVGERRFIGLFRSRVYAEEAEQIP